MTEEFNTERAEVVVTKDDRILNVPLDGLIRIELKENPTTGYRWQIDEIDSDAIKQVETSFRLSPGVGIGGGGTRILRLRAANSGEYRVRLKLWREWEGDRSIQERVDLEVRVYPGASAIP